MRELLTTFLIAAFFTPACHRARDTFPNAPVFLISIDTLRADHLSVYGSRDVDTPALDALARDSIVFDNAVSQVPLTLPSHAAIFTGLLPFQNGVRDNIGYALNPKFQTLAELLHRRGYATGAAVSAFVLNHGTGISRGFDFYDDHVERTEVSQVLGRVQRSGARTEAELEEWLRPLSGKRPVFAFLHLYEPHTPYEPPEPFKSRYAAHPYDGEIATADSIVGHFVEFLKTRGLYDESLVILLSDHGEGLGDHGEDEHGIFLYREELHVPLFVKLPGNRRAGERIQSPAALIDVFPTVAAITGEPSPSPGLSLLALPLDSGERRIYSETLYPRIHFGWSDLASLTDSRQQYIHAPRPELFDWQNDPSEQRDLAAALSPAFRSMRSEILAMSRPLQPPGATDPETVKKLASLGYLGNTAAPPAANDLPDPKDKIELVNRLKDAMRLASRHDEDQAVELLRGLAKENPKTLDVWETLARTLRSAWRTREAIEALTHADRLQPATPEILLGLAELYLEDGNLPRARASALAAKAAGASSADEELASISLAQGDLASARQSVELALEANPRGRTPRIISARIRIRTGDLPGALAVLAEAAKIGNDSGDAPVEGLESTRGDALARLGEEEKAIAAFETEIKDFPESADAWSKLAMLYASGRNGGGFHSTLSRMVSTMPTHRSLELARDIARVVGDKAEEEKWSRAAARAQNQSSTNSRISTK